MRKPARYAVASLRTVGSLMGPGLAIVFLLLASCDEVERHDMLTFFFDGVPPLHGETLEVRSSGAKKAEVTTVSPTGGWRVHKATKDCTNCHGDQRRRGFSSKVHLVAEAPHLCYQCHQEYSTLEGWVHGPVATGNCLFCHEPHKTKNEFLLLKPVPELCYQCHDLDAIHTIENHAAESYKHCVDCHEGHASETRGLLRPSFLAGPVGAEYQSEAHRRKYEQSLRKARSDLTQGQDFLAMSRTIIGHIESGRLWSARAYLEVLLDSGLVTDSEEAPVARVLQQVVALQTSGPAAYQEGPEGQTSPEAGREAPAAALRAVREQRRERERTVAELYYRSIRQYHAGQLVEAREGFRQVLEAESLPGPVKETAQGYLDRIEGALVDPQQPGWRPLQ